MKRPSFQFYPGDWLHDASLRLCSVGARGLWIDMLCVMHQGSDYGHLKVNHNPILPANLARLVGSTLEEVEGWLAELARAGVSEIGDDGAIYSRRMIRDEEIRLARAAGGVLGGNPALKCGKKVNHPTNLQPTPSSSSSTSSSKKEKRPAAPSLTVEELMRDGLSEEVATEWLAHRNRKKAVLTALAWSGFKQEVKKSGWSLEAAITKAIARGWTGFDVEWIKDRKGRNPDIERVTVDSNAAEKTKRQMEDDRMTPEQYAAAKKARDLALSSIKRVA